MEGLSASIGTKMLLLILENEFQASFQAGCIQSLTRKQSIKEYNLYI